MKAMAVYDRAGYGTSNLSGIRNEFVGLRISKYRTCSDRITRTTVRQQAVVVSAHEPLHRTLSPVRASTEQVMISSRYDVLFLARFIQVEKVPTWVVQKTNLGWKRI